MDILDSLNNRSKQAKGYIERLRKCKDIHIREINNYSKDYEKYFREQLQNLRNKKVQVPKQILEDFEMIMKELCIIHCDSRQTLVSQAIFSSRHQRVDESLLQINQDEYQEILKNIEQMPQVDFEQIQIKQRQQDLDQISVMVRELQLLINEMNDLVDKQGEQLDQVQFDMDKVKRNVYQKSVQEQQFEQDLVIIPKHTKDEQVPLIEKKYQFMFQVKTLFMLLLIVIIQIKYLMIIRETTTIERKLLNQLDMELKGMVNEAFRKSNPKRRWIDLSNDILTLDLHQERENLNIMQSYSKPIPKKVKIHESWSLPRNLRIEKEDKDLLQSSPRSLIILNKQSARRKSCECSYCGDMSDFQKRNDHLNAKTQQSLNSQRKLYTFSRIICKQQTEIKQFKLQQIRKKQIEMEQRSQSSISYQIMITQPTLITVPSQRQSTNVKPKKVKLPTIMHKRLISHISDLKCYYIGPKLRQQQQLTYRWGKSCLLKN